MPLTKTSIQIDEKKTINKQTNNCDKIIIHLLSQKGLSHTHFSDVSLSPISLILHYHHSHGDPRYRRLNFVTNEQISDNGNS